MSDKPFFLKKGTTVRSAYDSAFKTYPLREPLFVERDSWVLFAIDHEAGEATVIDVQPAAERKA